VKNLLENRNDIEIEAIGGENLKKLGVKLFVDHSKAHMSAMGLTPKILFDHITLGKRVVDYLKNEYKPDLVFLTIEMPRIGGPALPPNWPDT